MLSGSSTWWRAAGLALLAAGPAAWPPPTAWAQEQEPRSFYDTLRSRNLTRFRATLESLPDLYGALAVVPQLTVLAPSDAAFEKLAFSPLQAAFDANDTAAIRRVLSYHVLKGVYPIAAFNSTPAFPATFLEEKEGNAGTQHVSGVRQGGGEVVLISGLGSRSSIKRGVSFFFF